MVNLETVNEKMLMAIEMLMNNSDPNAEAKECMDVDTARTIANLGKVCVESYKVKANALAILAKADNPQRTTEIMRQSGIVSGKVLKLIDDDYTKD